MSNPALKPAAILLPKEGTDLEKWAVLACDQFTSQADYWRQTEQIVGPAPSTLRLILPEVYLEEADVPQRIGKIHTAMRLYSEAVLTQRQPGYVYVERTLRNGQVRQGLVGCVDLEDYSYEKGASPRIRPSENTVVERIPPRLAVRRGAALETPHILMLMDDVEKAVIEPLAAQKEALPLLYDVDLMQGGGRLRGWGVTEPKRLAALAAAMQRLDDKARFAALYGGEEKNAFALAVGDGNHSLATAKAYWDEIKPTVAENERQNHPARYCLVELENIQSAAIEIEPIHRVIFGARPDDLWQAAQQYLEEQNAQIAAAGRQCFTAVWQGGQKAFSVQNPPAPLAVGTLEGFLQAYTGQNPQVRVDYVHGEEAVRELAAQGAVGVLLPPFAKSDLFRGVALGGVLPKKTFSMGHAQEKRYYMECRKIEKQEVGYREVQNGAQQHQCTGFGKKPCLLQPGAGPA